MNKNDNIFSTQGGIIMKKKSKKEKFNIMANRGDAISITIREGKVVVASQTFIFKFFKLARLDPNIAVVVYRKLYT